MSANRNRDPDAVVQIYMVPGQGGDDEYFARITSRSADNVTYAGPFVAPTEPHLPADQAAANSAEYAWKFSGNVPQGIGKMAMLGLELSSTHRLAETAAALDEDGGITAENTVLDAIRVTDWKQLVDERGARQVHVVQWGDEVVVFGTDFYVNRDGAGFLRLDEPSAEFVGPQADELGQAIATALSQSERVPEL